MTKEYVERREGSFYLIGSRVPLARIVVPFQNGAPPEAIRLDFPTLTLEQVYGAITFFLANTTEVERDLAERRRAEEATVQSQPPLPPELRRKLDANRPSPLGPITPPPATRSWPPAPAV